MKKYILSLLVCLSAWNVQAHQTEVSSTMLVEQEDNKWFLNIRAALTAFEYEVKAMNLETPYKSAEEFQALVLQHIQDNLDIYFNEGDKITLKNGKVKLGHETNVFFEVEGVPATINSVYVKNSSFKDIHSNQSALIILKKGFTKKQFILNNKNDHTMNLKVADTQFIPFEGQVVTAELSPSSSYTSYAYGGIAFLLFCVLAFFWTKRNRQVKAV